METPSCSLASLSSDKFIPRKIQTMWLYKLCWSSSLQSCPTLWDPARFPCPSTNSWSLLRLMSTESVMHADQWNPQNYKNIKMYLLGFPWWLSSKESACQRRGQEFDSLIWEDTACRGASKPEYHHHWPPGYHYGSPRASSLCSTTREAHTLHPEKSHEATKTQHSQK